MGLFNYKLKSMEEIKTPKKISEPKSVKEKADFNLSIKTDQSDFRSYGGSREFNKKVLKKGIKAKGYDNVFGK